MKINIVPGYEYAEKYLYVWAEEEKYIDFRKEADKAARCTLAFAATELIAYLSRLSHEVVYSSKIQSGIFNLVLKAVEPGEGEEYSLIPEEYGLCILGSGRVGVLYGAYELLKLQGICWLNPWEEVIPEKSSVLKLPEKAVHFRPSFPMGRGFEFEGPLKESKKLFLWMARNRLNLSTYREATAKFQKKLGMIFKQGGHIFEKILNPDNPLPSGKTIWEEHPEWYGVPQNGAKTKDNVLLTEFCMSNEKLLEYLSAELLRRLQNEWYHVDRIDVWGFDTWGNCCDCDNCKALGNASDQTLHFMSYLRDYLDKALEDGRLDRKVNLVFGAYEGTSNLKAPINQIPENIRNSGDYISYAPILRCYEHCFDDEKCSYNKYYNKHLKAWCNIPDGIAMGMNEYYNVSKFEDIPFLFTNTMVNDIRYYHQLGVKCMTYMHLPMLHWGVRNLTQMIYAALCWDVNTDTDALIEKYFEVRYGSHREAVKKAYKYIEEAGKNCTSFRAWNQKSILTHLMNWDGSKPDRPLYRDDHVEKDTVGTGEAAVACYAEAIGILEKELCIAEEAFISTMDVCVPGIPLNPTDTRFKTPANVYGDRIREDLNYVRYAKDCMELITLFVAYYEALEQDRDAEGLFGQIEALANKMQSYYIPLRYDNPEAEIHCYTALRRSQLAGLYYRCKRYALIQQGKR